MLYRTLYPSPLGTMILISDEASLKGAWFKNQKYEQAKINNSEIKDMPNSILNQTINWLDRYFNQEKPSIKELPLDPIGTPFQKEVWHILCHIPYGTTLTYGMIADMINQKTGKKLGGQPVGQAVGHNPISIIIPCHRVIGSNGSLTGYAGGIDKKIKLLQLEGVHLENIA
ncbi:MULTISPECIES: methylated-DNA--[protein]-cysteine S-methyltransferase [Coprobacillaceae]|uniref:methylated-DNA--[protein]-cysteine S-methyltransferase n=1 Tax=Coprobacillaceae TaxID=2810280 RepID=UPI000E541D1D|nr:MULTISPECIES: methylated-DNA--[protein]-cysteine S-methyltransferase [Coprobacillaceae]RHM61474.1 methylated-DNA--[protein]-cysteine S-methyltransferase [Coprobacillus sp. AF33-1AC]RHS93981.1 methylated-DNA--[protein]-cysteine S-methyltransferase [Erysipelatoclostridium sp. AM42-17]